MDTFGLFAQDKEDYGLAPTYMSSKINLVSVSGL